MRFWVISDTHLGHDAPTSPMITKCGRPSDFSIRICNNLAEMMLEDDILIHLGDFCFGNDEMHHDGLNVIPGTKWLVRGNHDRKQNSWYLTHGWSMVCDTFEMTRYGKKLIFSHKPLIIEPNVINIHGHFHNNDHRSCEPGLTDILTPNHVLLVLEDNDYRPWRLDKLIRRKGLI
jgi:calcineurin-like phosphoesterase family protein